MGNIKNVRFTDFETDKIEYQIGPGDQVFVYIKAAVYTDGLTGNVTVYMTKPNGIETLTLVPSMHGDNASYEQPYRLDQFSAEGLYVLTAKFDDQIPCENSISFTVSKK